MSYPLSSEVVEGQATEAAQYNNLRMDALYLGGDPASSGTVRDLLLSNGNINLIREGKTTIKLTASSSAPVGLMIGGGIYSVSETITLTISNDVLPTPGRYPIYAVASGAGFVLSLNAGDITRQIGSFCWDGTGVIPGTIHTTEESKILASKSPAAASGRLSLVAGDPIPDSDITAGTVLYFIPYHGKEIAIFLFDEWEYFQLPTQISLSTSGLLPEMPYDVFLSVDSDGLALSVASWGSAVIRPGGTLAWKDGIRVSGSDYAKRYLGSFALNSNGKFEDSRTGRLIWNENNRMARPILAKLVTVKTQGVAHLNAWAPYYDEDAPVVRLLIPVSDAEFELTGYGISSPISETDRGYQRAASIGVIRDAETESPYTGNKTCAAAGTYTFGNGPMTADVENLDSGFIGLHKYTLAFWANYNYFPAGTGIATFTQSLPGLYGQIYA